MQIYLPWIKKRLIIIRNIFKDLLIYFTLYFILQLEIYLKTNLLFISFYILISYLIGRYHFYKEKKINEPSEDFINTIMSEYEDFSSSTSLVKLNLILEKEINKEIRDNIKNLNI